MRIAYIGPPGRSEVLQKWASSGVTVETRHHGFNGAIESMYDEYMYIPGMLETVIAIQQEGFDAALVGCFGDPALDGAREVVTIPVIGPAESCFSVAASLADTIGVITATDELTRLIRRLAHKYGVEGKLVGVSSIGCPIMDIRRDPAAQYPHLVRAAERMVEQGADSLILGCGSMSFYAEQLSQDVGVPCLNPLRVGLRMAELLVGAGLSHSKRSYPYPTSLRSGANA